MIASIPRMAHVEILGVLLLMLAASSMTFWLLVRRWTTERQLVALVEWGKNAGFRVIPLSDRQLVQPLQVLEKHGAQIETQMADPANTLVQVRAHAITSAEAGRRTADVRWNLLVRSLESSWKPVGLRPSKTQRSVLDFFSMSSFSILGGIERFLLYAADSDAAKEFPESTARSLLPPDIGLLLHGNKLVLLVLDFSDRPFDDLEFNRMIALAAQLELKLIRQSKDDRHVN